MNKLDISIIYIHLLNDAERTQIREIVENSVTKNISINNSKNGIKNKYSPQIPDNTIKITYSDGNTDTFENVKITSSNMTTSNMSSSNMTTSNMTTSNISLPQQNIPIVIKEPTTYQKQVLSFLKKCQNDADRKGAFLKLLMKSQKKHQDAFDGFTTLINRVSGISADAKADYISVIADFEAFLIGLAARGQKTYNDMEIFHLVSLINGAK